MILGKCWDDFFATVQYICSRFGMFFVRMWKIIILINCGNKFCFQVWNDYQLQWDEADYGGISVLRYSICQKNQNQCTQIITTFAKLITRPSENIMSHCENVLPLLPAFEQISDCNLVFFPVTKPTHTPPTPPGKGISCLSHTVKHSNFHIMRLSGFQTFENFTLSGFHVNFTLSGCPQTKFGSRI